MSQLRQRPRLGRDCRPERRPEPEREAAHRRRRPQGRLELPHRRHLQIHVSLRLAAGMYNVQGMLKKVGPRLRDLLPLAAGICSCNLGPTVMYDHASM